jgi:hypothetical protein
LPFRFLFAAGQRGSGDRMSAITEDSDAVRAALWAARRGWHVHPLRPDDKPPLWGDWEHRATVDPELIRSWPKRTTGYGIACGPSGLLVVDCDVPKPNTPPPPADGIHDGLDTLAYLAEERQASIEWGTFQVTTGRGGAHLYYQMPDGVVLGNTAGRLGWLLDSRGRGGFVVGPGSVVGGRRYTTLHSAPPAPLPGWILLLLASRSGENPAGQARAVSARPGSPAAVAVPVAGAVGPEWAAAALSGEAERIRTVRPTRSASSSAPASSSATRQRASWRPPSTPGPGRRRPTVTEC